MLGKIGRLHFNPLQNGPDRQFALRQRLDHMNPRRMGQRLKHLRLELAQDIQILRIHRYFTHQLRTYAISQVMTRKKRAATLAAGHEKAPAAAGFCAITALAVSVLERMENANEDF